ncbi:hypothetical protein Gohar_027057, partial [Gossypium harknessii]|nr:hypothetical protein [Gossypium harknessii]
TKKKINSPVVEKKSKEPETSSVEKRNKEPAEEQRTSTSRGTKNQHQQRNKEPAMREDMRAKNQRS